MGIPESQLETWSHQGSITQSSSTYKSIKSTLEAGGTPYEGKAVSVFLQGSYGNDTNIYAESDVDVVLKSDAMFFSDLSYLQESEKDAWSAAFKDASYTYDMLKNDVISTLRASYGNDVKPGSKAIAIDASGSRRKADVIVAAEFRRYWKFNGLYDQRYESGICFFNSAGQRIANYPRQHSSNLTDKHQATSGWLKPMVRILKNMRSKCVEQSLLKPGQAPSYYIEGLLYNVPAGKFGQSYSDSFVNALNWLQNDADKDKLVCANEQYYLLRDGAHTCWPKADGLAYVNAVTTLWKQW